MLERYLNVSRGTFFISEMWTSFVRFAAYRTRPPDARARCTVTELLRRVALNVILVGNENNNVSCRSCVYLILNITGPAIPWKCFAVAFASCAPRRATRACRTTTDTDRCRTHVARSLSATRTGRPYRRKEKTAFICSATSISGTVRNGPWTFNEKYIRREMFLFSAFRQ